MQTRIIYICIHLQNYIFHYRTESAFINCNVIISHNFNSEHFVCFLAAGIIFSNCVIPSYYKSAAILPSPQVKSDYTWTYFFVFPVLNWLFFFSCLHNCHTRLEMNKLHFQILTQLFTCITCLSSYFKVSKLYKINIQWGGYTCLSACFIWNLMKFNTVKVYSKVVGQIKSTFVPISPI
jgi:hypothetical protein